MEAIYDEQWYANKFEELVAELFKSKGYDVQLTPRTRDGGVKTGFDFSFTNQVVQGNLRKELFFFHAARVS